MDRRSIGAWGENLAACFLDGLGYEILERNLRIGHVEVDLLVRRGEILAIVEVRLRSSVRRGQPEESVSWRKRRHLERAWRHLATRHPEARWIRMDIISIVRQGSRAVRIRHFPSAWVPPGLAPF
jgi:putative endonuclease